MVRRRSAGPSSSSLSSSVHAASRCFSPNNEEKKKEIDILYRHIQQCPDVPDTSWAKAVVLSGLEQETKKSSVRDASRCSSPNNKEEKKEIDILYRHIQQCPNVPETSWAKAVVLSGLEQETTKKRNTALRCSSSPSKQILGMVCCFRSILIDLPLIICFVTFLLLYSLQQYYDDYCWPFINAVRWKDRLEHEITYYDRTCDVRDITTDDVNDLLLLLDNTDAGGGGGDDGSVKKKSAVSAAEDAVDNMMIHGLSIFPNILQTQTLHNLRSHILNRIETTLTDEEMYPVDQGENRISFGIDPNEHPSVAQALNEISTHELLRPTLQGLMGDVNPAITEITTLVSYPGAEEQLWHYDVKPLASATKYVQSFAHSYSLFIPLQNTTSKMGATGFCPGSHYCTNGEDFWEMYELCTDNEVVASGENGVWQEGYGALFNQHVYHRATAHTDYNAPARVAFVVSFFPRPKVSKDDKRQLSHGTYFHIRSDCWGHTLNDLFDVTKYMNWPYNILKSYGIWKLPMSQWGYDFVTSSLLRIANYQSGFDEYDLEVFATTWLKETWYIPQSLLGNYPIDGEEWDGEYDERYAWENFIHDTLELWVKFATKVNLLVLGLYLVVVGIRSLVLWWTTRKLSARRCQEHQPPSLFCGAILRLFTTHALITILAFYLYHQYVTLSVWSTSIRSGEALAPPFPSYSSDNNDDNNVGPTTLPDRNDVLIGIRYDTKFLGSYRKFLDYHPGNVKFRSHVSNLANMYVTYDTGLPSVFGDTIVKSIVDAITTDDGGTKGRFLQQNERGDWMVLPMHKSLEQTRRALYMEHVPILRALNQEVAYLLFEARFGYKLRGTNMGRLGVDMALQWREVLFQTVVVKTMSSSFVDGAGGGMVVPKERTTTLSRSVVRPNSSSVVAAAAVPMHVTQQVSAVIRHSGKQMVQHSRSWTMLPDPTMMKAQTENDDLQSNKPFAVGDIVYSQQRHTGQHIKSSIIAVHPKKGRYTYHYFYDILNLEGYDEDDEGYKYQRSVSHSNLQPYVPYQEGDIVEIYDEENRWYSGTLLRVTPTRTVTVRFDDDDDGDVEEGVPVEEIRKKKQ